MSLRTFKCLIVVTALAFTGACSPPKRAVVEERSVLTVKQQSEKIGGQLVRIAQSGDTLYGIAFASNLDIRQLAAWNGIDDITRLRAGQRIRLTKPIGFVAKKPAVSPRATKSGASKSRSQVANNRSTKSTPSKSRNEGNEVVAKEAKHSAKKLPKQEVATKKPNKGSKQIVKAASAKPQNSNSAADSRKLKWHWPSNGRVLRRFSPSSTQQGIDIAGTQGQKVLATAAGEVVYVGNSLKGYGNLIIVKHNDDFLSAYAHNQVIRVKEGQKITDRQLIGSIGINNRRERALHFQIRLNGKPVDPLKYLPKSRS